MTWALLWRVVWGFRIPVPVIPLVAAIGLWWAWGQVGMWVNTRAAVKSAIEDLVAGERIAGLEATIRAKDEIAQRARHLADQEAAARLATQRAMDNLRSAAAKSEIEKDDFNDQISELLARPVDADCRVDPDLYGRLRKR